MDVIYDYRLTCAVGMQGLLPPAVLAKLSSQHSASSSSSSSCSSSSSGGEQLFTREELALYVGGKPPQKQQIYIAILGQVFDVSTAPQFYSEWQRQQQRRRQQQQQQQQRQWQQLLGSQPCRFYFSCILCAIAEKGQIQGDWQQQQQQLTACKCRSRSLYSMHSC
jgi:hypothetical protein